MLINLNKIDLEYDTNSYIEKADKEKKLEMYQKEIKKYINILDKIVNCELKKIPDKEFYDLISEVYSIILDSNDYLEIISKLNNKKYNYFTEIGTYMTFESTITGGYERDFAWKQLYQKKYVIAVSEDIDIEYNTIFKKEEIEDLIENKKIFIVKSIYEPIYNKLNYNEEFEIRPLIEFNFSNESMHGYMKENSNFPIFISILRKKLTKKRILIDIKNYVSELQNEIDIISSYNSDNLKEKQKVNSLIRKQK